MGEDKTFGIPVSFSQEYQYEDHLLFSDDQVETCWMALPLNNIRPATLTSEEQNFYYEGTMIELSNGRFWSPVSYDILVKLREGQIEEKDVWDMHPWGVGKYRTIRNAYEVVE